MRIVHIDYQLSNAPDHVHIFQRPTSVAAKIDRPRCFDCRTGRIDWWQLSPRLPRFIRIYRKITSSS